MTTGDCCAPRWLGYAGTRGLETVSSHGDRPYFVMPRAFYFDPIDQPRVRPSDTLSLTRSAAMNQDQRSVFIASGEIHAQQVRAFLEAAGISSALHGESLRNTHGLTLDGLGMVRIIVAAADEERARALLASAEAGAFRLEDDIT